MLGSLRRRLLQTWYPVKIVFLFHGQVFNTECQIDLTFLNHRSRTRKTALQESWYYFLIKLFPGTPPKEKPSFLKEKGDIFPLNFIQTNKLREPF